MRISDWSSDVCSSDLRVSDKPPVLPEFLEEAGDIYFSGDFEGKFDDFTAGGELKTSLGQITGEASMQFGAAVPTYSGNIHAQDINLQLLTGSKSLGKATFNATVEGAGFNLKDLEENLSRSEEHTSELQSLMRIPYTV